MLARAAAQQRLACLRQASLRRSRGSFQIHRPLYHRIAISNQRLVSVGDGKVTFRYKDYAHENAQRTMSLDAVKFLR